MAGLLSGNPLTYGESGGPPVPWRSSGAVMSPSPGGPLLELGCPKPFLAHPS